MQVKNVMVAEGNNTVCTDDQEINFKSFFCSKYALLYAEGSFVESVHMCISTVSWKYK